MGRQARAACELECRHAAGQQGARQAAGAGLAGPGRAKGCSTSHTHKQTNNAVHADLGAGHAGLVGAGRHLLVEVVTGAHKHATAHDEAVLAGGLGRGVGLQAGLGETEGAWEV